MVCNGLLREVAKETVAGRMPPVSRAQYDEVSECAECGRIFWKGTHYQRMLRLLEEMRKIC